MGTGWLHLTGLALGVPLAVALLKWKLVDCEDWDLFHVIRGDYGPHTAESEPDVIHAKVEARQRQRDVALRARPRSSFSCIGSRAISPPP